jgi:hypothetical protein
MDIRKHQAAERGFEIFLANDAQISRQEINFQLALDDMPEISVRTYGHYGRMAKRGVSVYLPINEFDMAVKHHQYPEAS